MLGSAFARAAAGPLCTKVGRLSSSLHQRFTGTLARLAGPTLSQSEECERGPAEAGPGHIAIRTA